MAQTMGKQIMQHRKRLGLTQEQLAEKLGVTAQAVSKWENDQSCPDISILGTLADIFGISTDVLLGRVEETTVYEAEVVEEAESEGIHIQKGNWEFQYDSGRRGSVCFALLVLAVGGQLFAGKLLHQELSFWSALWPSALTVYGLFGLLRKFSFVSAGCLLFGSYFALDNWNILPFDLGGELVFPIVLVLFGLSLLVDALKKPWKPSFHFRSNGKQDKSKNDLRVEGETLQYCASFGEGTQEISIDLLSQGNIDVCFGDYCVDLQQVRAVSDDCDLEVNCSFGDLILLVPRRFAVRPSNSVSFGDISISGSADPEPKGVIQVEANVSFGQITIRYI